MTDDPARVFVVAPTPFVRAGLRSMLEGEEEAGVLVVGEAASLPEPVLSGSDAVLLVAEEEVLEGAARDLVEEGAHAILLITGDDRPVDLLREIAPRGWGVVPPDARPEELSAAIRAVARGLVVLPRTLTGRLLRGSAVVEEDLAEPLTAREREVLGLLGRGLSNKMIARDLEISEHTVKFHVSSVYAKLGAGSRAEAVSLGARLGLISL